MQEYKQRKNELKKAQFSTSNKNVPLAIQALLIYLCFISFDVVGRICLQSAYRQQGLHDLANIQWFCYEMVAVLGLAQLPKIVNLVTFRIILLLGAIGPQIFLAPAYYSLVEDPDIWLIYILGITSSLVAGVLSVILLFGMVYYLSNLSFGEEKILYYSSLYFFHSSQWLFGSCIAEVFYQYNFNLPQILLYVAIFQGIFSLLFLTIIEPKHPRLRRTKEQILTLIEIKYQNNKKQNQKNMIRQLITGDMVEDVTKSQSDEDLRKNIIANMTVQCFSLDSSSLSQIVDNDQFEHYNANYYVNILNTIRKLWKLSIVYMIPLIMTVAFLESFLYIDLINFIYLVYSQQIGSSPNNSQIQEIQEVYLYVGLGYILGCFAIGLFGDYKDKMIWMLFMITLLQFSFIFAWVGLSQRTPLFFIVEIFSAMIGFCSSGLTSTIIAFLCFEFSEQIYMIDVLYITYSFFFACASLIYMIEGQPNVLHFQIEFGVIQVLGIIDYIALYQYYKIKKQSKIQ